jgi:hypothetical protein
MPTNDELATSTTGRRWSMPSRQQREAASDDVGGH